MSKALKSGKPKPGRKLSSSRTGLSSTRRAGSAASAGKIGEVTYRYWNGKPNIDVTVTDAEGNSYTVPWGVRICYAPRDLLTQEEITRANKYQMEFDMTRLYYQINKFVRKEHE